MWYVIIIIIISVIFWLQGFLYDGMEITRLFFGLQLDDFIISAYGKEQREDNYAGSNHQAVAMAP